MNQKIDNRVKKFTLLYESLRKAGLSVSMLKGGILVNTESGFRIEIFSLTGNPDQIRARIKLKETDPLRRQAFIESIHNTLSAALKETATSQSFYLSRETGDAYIYNSVIKINDLSLDDEPIEIGADAIEIIDDAKPEPADEPMFDINAGADSQLSFASQLEDASGTDDLGAFELDFGFEEENHMKVVKSLSEEALEQLENIDAKTLRQTLDMMNLKRSSVVRLAVTRIFRSASDLSELERTVRDEAKRIISPEDRAELQDIKALSGNGFLDPVIDMLWQEVFS